MQEVYYILMKVDRSGQYIIIIVIIQQHITDIQIS
jgi:hypothetical protein